MNGIFENRYRWIQLTDACTNLIDEEVIKMQKIWRELEASFPEWEVHHTGGGNFALRKDFHDLAGTQVLVAISDTVALIMKDVKNSTRYINHQEFLNNEDVYWDEGAFDLEVNIVTLDEGVIKYSNEAKIFAADTIKEIASGIKRVSEIIWDN